MASSANVEATEPKGRVEEMAMPMDDEPIQKEMEERKKMKEMKKIKNTYKSIERIMKEPEVKRMSDRMKYIDYLEKPQRSNPCFPSSSVKSDVYEEKLYDPDCVLRYNHFGFLRRREMLIELVSKRLKEKERLRRKIKKGIKQYMNRIKRDLEETKGVNLAETVQAKQDVARLEDGHEKRGEMMLDVSASSQADELKETKGVNLAETVQAKQDVGRLEGGHEKREELMLDVSASSQVDELRRRTLPYEQTGKLMEGLKSCTIEAGKKSASHSEGI